MRGGAQSAARVALIAGVGQCEQSINKEADHNRDSAAETRLSFVPLDVLPRPAHAVPCRRVSEPTEKLLSAIPGNGLSHVRCSWAWGVTKVETAHSPTDTP